MSEFLFFYIFFGIIYLVFVVFNIEITLRSVVHEGYGGDLVEKDVTYRTRTNYLKLRLYSTPLYPLSVIANRFVMTRESLFNECYEQIGSTRRILSDSELNAYY